MIVFVLNASIPAFHMSIWLVFGLSVESGAAPGGLRGGVADGDNWV